MRAVDETPFKTSYGLHSCPIGNVYTVGHVLREYFEYRRHFTSIQALQGALSLTNYYILPLLGDLAADEVTPDDLRALLLRVEATPRRHGAQPVTELIDPGTLDPEARRRRRVTANHTYSLLRTALEMAWREGRVFSNRAWMSVKPFRVRKLGRLSVLSWQQAKNLVDAAHPVALKRLILAGLYTGCRITELFRLRVEDLAWNRMAIYVRPLKNYRSRTIALPEEGYKFFRHLADQRLGSSELLLVRDDGSPWPHAYACEKLKILRGELGLSDDIVFHTLRHTYASLLLEAGAAPLIVARQLGHSTMQTVINTYAHLTDDFIDVEFRHRFRPGFIADLDLGNL